MCPPICGSPICVSPSHLHPSALKTRSALLLLTNLLTWWSLADVLPKLASYLKIPSCLGTSWGLDVVFAAPESAWDGERSRCLTYRTLETPCKLLWCFHERAIVCSSDAFSVFSSFSDTPPSDWILPRKTKRSLLSWPGPPQHPNSINFSINH